MAPGCRANRSNSTWSTISTCAALVGPAGACFLQSWRRSRCNGMPLRLAVSAVDADRSIPHSDRRIVTASRGSGHDRPHRVQEGPYDGHNPDGCASNPLSSHHPPLLQSCSPAQVHEVGSTFIGCQVIAPFRSDSCEGFLGARSHARFSRRHEGLVPKCIQSPRAATGCSVADMREHLQPASRRKRPRRALPRASCAAATHNRRLLQPRAAEPIASALPTVAFWCERARA